MDASGLDDKERSETMSQVSDLNAAETRDPLRAAGPLAPTRGPVTQVGRQIGETRVQL
jgi:hypothetical protein